MAYHYSQSRQGMALLQWLVIALVVGGVAAWGVMHTRALRARQRASDAKAVLQALVDAELGVKAARLIDTDGDELGEYAPLRTLLDPFTYAAAAPGMEPPRLPLSPLAADGDACCTGTHGIAVFMDSTLSREGIDSREQFFAVVAWPLAWTVPEDRCYAMLADGSLYECPEPLAAGIEDPLRPEDLLPAGLASRALPQAPWVLLSTPQEK